MVAWRLLLHILGFACCSATQTFASIQGQGFNVQWLGSWKLAGCGSTNKSCAHEPWPSALPAASASPQFNQRVFLFSQGLGYYPYVNSSGGYVNGGLPQSPAFDLQRHLMKVRADLQAFAAVAGPAAPSNSSAHAYCCIDWEAAYPMLELGSNARNMNLSMELAKRGSPQASDAELAGIAVRAFNGAAQRLWLQTLQTAQAVMPDCSWGFYGLPRIFSMGGGYTADEQALHDRLLPLLAASDALFPSVYLHYRSAERGDEAWQHNSWLVHSTIQEGRRLLSQLPPPVSHAASHHHGHREVVPWVDFEYLTNAPDPSVRGKIVSALDMELQLRGAAEEGCSTVLMYEDGTTHNLSAAVDLMWGTMVPAVTALNKGALACRASLCHGHGICIANQSACECDVGSDWSGPRCDKGSGTKAL